MSQQLPETWFIRDRKVNAAIAWVITALLLLTAISGLLSFRLVDVVLALMAAIIAIIPAYVSRTWTRTVPWPLLLLASIPLIVGAIRPTFFDLLLTGVGVAALGMLLVVILQLTTTVRMTPPFAIASVVLATLAFAGFWAVGSAFDATYLGGTFVETNAALMNIFTAALLGGLIGGLVFRWYFHRQLRKPDDSPPAGEVERA